MWLYNPCLLTFITGKVAYPLRGSIKMGHEWWNATRWKAPADQCALVFSFLVASKEGKVFQHPSEFEMTLTTVEPPTWQHNSGKHIHGNPIGAPTESWTDIWLQNVVKEWTCVFGGAKYILILYTAQKTNAQAQIPACLNPVGRKRKIYTRPSPMKVHDFMVSLFCREEIRILEIESILEKMISQHWSNHKGF